MDQAGLKIVQKFVACINAHDVDAIVKMMSPKFQFIDSLGGCSSFKQMHAGWRQYFTMVPDYWIAVEREVADGKEAILIGRAGGTYAPAGAGLKAENKWETPAVWRAKVSGQELTEWRIYADNEPIRQKMRAASGPER